MSVMASAMGVLQNQYNILSQKIKRLYNLYAESNNDLLLETIKENQANLTFISQQIEREKESKKTTIEMNEKRNAILALKRKWDTLTMREKRQALKMCIGNITVTDDLIDIRYNF